MAQVKILKWIYPIDQTEKDERFLLLEDLGNRYLVQPMDFPHPIKPTFVYSSDEMEIEAVY